MPGRKPPVAIALGLCLVLALLAAGWRLLDRRATSLQPPTIAQEQGPRIWYSPGSFPRLALPDGKHQTVRSVLNIKTALAYGDYIWNDDFVPKGPRWVRIDLKRQLISIFRGGHEIGTAVILYGADSMPSPTGTYPVLEKAADYHSRTYDAPMPFTLMLTADGVAIHGSDVRQGAATHGCIGVPLEFARRLFEEVRVGDPVFIEQRPA